MSTTVALDLETTGLDPERDTIIEIGIVCFHGARVDREWSSLVNPGRHVPDFISALTGIDDAMLRDAPHIAELLPTISELISNNEVVGHNISFDLGFLQKHIRLPGNIVADTYDLASVLLPSAGRYNLGSLAKELGILLPATHRALDDARVTQQAYVRLGSLANDLPIELLQELVRLGQNVDWGGKSLLRTALQARINESTGRMRSMSRSVPRSATVPPPELDVPDEPKPIDLDETAAVLEFGGPFSKFFANFEQRPEQVQMLRAVTRALDKGKHLLVEAGTGVGKSFAYLVPAAKFAVHNNTRVVISTNTINLQDQLIRKDIPDLASALGLDVRAAVLKGRANYLCPRRLDNLKRAGPRSAEDMRVLGKILVWQSRDESGDRSLVNLNGPVEREIWSRLSAEDEGCTAATCLSRQAGTCAFHRARVAAQSAHLLVVNHALLLADSAAAGQVLPQYNHLIIDEGHHLEAAMTDALSFRATEGDIARLLRQIGGQSGGAVREMLSVAKRALPPAEIVQLDSVAKELTDRSFRLDQRITNLFRTTAAFVEELREQEQRNSVYAWQQRILPGTRTLPGWTPVELAWDETAHDWQQYADALQRIQELAASALIGGTESLNDALGDVTSSARRLAEIQANLTAAIAKPQKDKIYWLNLRPSSGEVDFNAAPLRVGNLIQDTIWNQKLSVIVTSATLTANNEFQYIRSSLGAEGADELQLGSPFDYENSTMLYLVSDAPEPNAPQYQQVLNNAIISTAKAAGGRMLALFTSYASLKRTAAGITSSLAREDIMVFEQGDGASPNMLLESFRSTEKAVLLGTRSFWEGVDIPGSALSVLFITKLPFDVPTDPLIAARSELYEDAFQEYYLPEAILKFRQGFGRLIRTASDRGIVAVLDKRILTKPYGRSFLQSLPQCTSRQGPIAALSRETSRWLAN